MDIEVSAKRLNRFLLESRDHGQLTDEEKRALIDTIHDVKLHPARAPLVRQGEKLEFSLLLLEGIVSRYLDDMSGRRQLLSIHFSGDFLDLHAFPLKALDHDVGTLTECRIAQFLHKDLERLSDEYPRLMRKLWFATLLDAALHRKWVWRLGRLRAVSRIAHFFCECHARLTGAGLSKGERFDLGLTQADLADISGLTVVHTNRVLRELRERGLAVFRDGVVEITDREGLWKLGQFNPDYLYLSPEAMDRVVNPQSSLPPPGLDRRRPSFNDATEAEV